MIDPIDRKILRVLQSSGRTPNSALADQVGISEAPCWRRVKRLEEEELIRGYGAQLDRRLLGFGVLAFVHVRISAHDLEHAEQFEQEIRQLTNVQECHNVTGADDYLLKVLAKDLDDYSEFTITLRRLPGVIAIQSSLSLREIKSTTTIPI